MFFKPGNDRGTVGRRIGFEQGGCRNDEACGAISALRGTFGDKGFLDGGTDRVFLESFDGHDFPARELTRRAVTA
jgi:hypothetical protein